jgi:hypothetical protein
MRGHAPCASRRLTAGSSPTPLGPTPAISGVDGGLGLTWPRRRHALQYPCVHTESQDHRSGHEPGRG